MSAPDHNADAEHGQGEMIYAVRNSFKGMPVKSVQTSMGELKLDKKGRCIVKDKTVADEIRQTYGKDLTVSRLFRHHPADRGHRYFHGQVPAMPWHQEDEYGRRIRDTEPLEEAPSLQDEAPGEVRKQEEQT
jgi:hypothetical protein